MSGILGYGPRPEHDSIRTAEMTRLLLALPPLFLLLCSAHAEIAKTSPPADETNLLGTAVFIALFVGACAVFFWYVWRNEQKAEQKKGGGATKS
jgi:hypothetical protein